MYHPPNDDGCSEAVKEEDAVLADGSVWDVLSSQQHLQGFQQMGPFTPGNL
jgi:hypothetical protein